MTDAGKNLEDTRGETLCFSFQYTVQVNYDFNIIREIKVVCSRVYAINDAQIMKAAKRKKKGSINSNNKICAPKENRSDCIIMIMQIYAKSIREIRWSFNLNDSGEIN